MIRVLMAILMLLFVFSCSKQTRTGPDAEEQPEVGRPVHSRWSNDDEAQRWNADDAERHGLTRIHGGGMAYLGCPVRAHPRDPQPPRS